MDRGPEQKQRQLWPDWLTPDPGSGPEQWLSLLPHGQLQLHGTYSCGLDRGLPVLSDVGHRLWVSLKHQQTVPGQLPGKRQTSGKKPKQGREVLLSLGSACEVQT